MTKPTMHRKLAWLCAAGLAATACTPNDEATGTTSQAVNGPAAPTRTEVAVFNNGNTCSAVVIHPRYALTAGHCVNSQNERYDGVSTNIAIVDGNNRVSGQFFAIRAHTFGHLGDENSPVGNAHEQTGDGGTTDVALLQIAGPIASNMVPIWPHYPAHNQAATMFGFGCGSFSRKSFTWTFGQAISGENCDGDSGGPAVIGDVNGFAVWSLVTGSDSNGHNDFGAAEFYADKIMSQIQNWDHTDFEVGFDRTGFDYTYFDLTSGDTSPTGCRSLCMADGQCRAFTYVAAGVDGPSPRCFLKNAVPPYSPCSVCTSGIKLAQEVGVDRFGSDYASFTPADTRPEICLAACGRDPACKSYAYVPPGFFSQGSAPECFLKSDGASRMANPSVTAGLKRGLEPNYDRTGDDYTWFKTTNSDPDSCRQSCAQDQRCRSFTYVAAGVTEPSAECHLKSDVPDPVASTGMTSGVKRGFEIGFDRPGGDLTNFDLGTPTPEACQAACQQNSQCLSFTFAPPGYNGSASAPAHCWLKSAIPPQVANEPLISGMKGADFF